MLIWVCDACGCRVEKQPIVGSEFDYDEAGFGSLGVPINGMQDFCGPCLAKVTKAVSGWEQRRRAGYHEQRGDVIRAAIGALDVQDEADVLEVSDPPPTGLQGFFKRAFGRSTR